MPRNQAELTSLADKATPPHPLRHTDALAGQACIAVRAAGARVYRPAGIVSRCLKSGRRPPVSPQRPDVASNSENLTSILLLMKTALEA